MVGVTGRPVATDKSQESWEFSESESWSDHEKIVSGNLVPRVVCQLHHSTPKYQGKLDAESVQKREADTQRTQAYHSERQSSMSISSRDLEAFGKHLATTSSRDSENF